MQTDLIAHLTLAAPEVLLAVGALALLMIGVFSGERAATLVNGLSVAVLIAALALVVLFRRTAPHSAAPSSQTVSAAS